MKNAASEIKTLLDRTPTPPGEDRTWVEILLSDQFRGPERPLPEHHDQCLCKECRPEGVG